jgi:hypothetical protein
MDNTIALAYLNKEGEIVAWSADTFGSPRDYPKTYEDCLKNRDMLSRKFRNREEFGNATSDLIGSLNSFGGAIMKASLEVDKDIFSEKGIISSKIIELPIETDYKIDLPKWESVKNCIDSRNYL